MSNRTAIIASAIIAGCASIFSITSIQIGSARAADECLAAPKATTPAGGHWYYRLEKETKRKCWYLGDAGAKVNKSAAAKSAPADEQDASEPAATPDQTSATAPAPAIQKPMKKSVANARAELSAAAPDEDPALAGSTWPPLNESTSNAPAGNGDQAAAIQPRPSVTDPSSTQSWTMASRWPEPNSNAGDRSSASPEKTAPPPALTADRLVTAAAATPDTTPTALAPAASAPQPVEPETISVGLLVSVLAGVLALAAIIGPLIYNYAKPRRPKGIAAPSQRRAIWDTDAPLQNTPLFAQDEYRRRPVVLDDERYLDDRGSDEQHRVTDDTTADEIEALLARASKRSAA